jgi:hypothetical protein
VYDSLARHRIHWAGSAESEPHQPSTSEEGWRLLFMRSCRRPPIYTGRIRGCARTSSRSSGVARIHAADDAMLGDTCSSAFAVSQPVLSERQVPSTLLPPRKQWWSQIATTSLSSSLPIHFASDPTERAIHTDRPLPPLASRQLNGRCRAGCRRCDTKATEGPLRRCPRQLRSRAATNQGEPLAAQSRTMMV